MFVYLKQNKDKTAARTKLHEAFQYMINQEKYLRVFLNDGDVPMDNNASERAIRDFCIGKKNWEVIDTINGAGTSAIIYSIAETAKANNLKPYDYFEYLLTEIRNTWKIRIVLSWTTFCRGHLNCRSTFENQKLIKAAKAAYRCQGTCFETFTLDDTLIVFCYTKIYNFAVCSGSEKKTAVPVDFCKRF